MQHKGAAHMPLIGAFLQRSRHGTTFFFRRRVPDDLRVILGRNQLYRSLGTAELRPALAQARRLAAETDELFTRLRDMTKRQPPGSGEHMPYGDVWGSWGRPEKAEKGPKRLPSSSSMPDPLPASVTALQRPFDASVSQGAGTRVNYTIVVTEDTAAGTRTTEVTVDPDKPGDQEAALAMIERIKGNAAVSAPAVARAPVITLSKLVDEFLQTLRSSKTVRAYRTALVHHFLPHFGADTDIQDVDQDAFAVWVKKVFDDETRGHATKQGYVNAVTSMFSWRAATNSKTTPALSTKKLIPQKEEAAADERDPFEPRELAAVLKNAATYRKVEPHKFWITVCVAFMGCRIEELAQANLHTDLRHDSASDIYYISVNQDADPDGVKRKALKKPSSKRVVPIHSALIRHGLLDYFSTQKAAGASRPFERGWEPWVEPDRDEHLYSHSITKWGGRELKKLANSGAIAVSGRKLAYFHSMRRAQTNHYSRCGVSEEHRGCLHGQVVGSGENGKRYMSLRNDVAFMSKLVEDHLDDYVVMLDEAVQASDLRLVYR